MISSAHARSIWYFLVSGFLTEVIQQIHSLRASGVRSFHASRTADDEVRALCRSAGILCTTPVASSSLGISLLLLASCSQSIEVEDTSETTCDEQSEELTLYNGDSITLDDHTITVQDVTLGSADIDVDYSSSYISTGSSLEINGVNVEVISTDTELSTVTLTLALC